MTRANKDALLCSYLFQHQPARNWRKLGQENRGLFQLAHTARVWFGKRVKGIMTCRWGNNYICRCLHNQIEYKQTLWIAKVLDVPHVVVGPISFLAVHLWCLCFNVHTINCDKSHSIVFFHFHGVTTICTFLWVSRESCKKCRDDSILDESVVCHQFCLDSIYLRFDWK